MPAKRPATAVNRSEMASIAGVEGPTLDNWVRKGCPFVKKGSKGVPWEFDPTAVLKWRDAYKRKKTSGPGAPVIELNDVRQRKMTAEAQISELELAERLGSVIPIEDVAELVEAEYTNVRLRLTALPGELATELEHLTPSEIQDVLAESIEDVLRELSADTKYSAKKDSGPAPNRRKGKLS